MVHGPCKDCPDRGEVKVGDKVVRCHTVCERFLKFRAEPEAEKQRIERAISALPAKELSRGKWR